LTAEAGYPPGQLLYAELLQLDRTDQGDKQALQLIDAAAEAGLAAAQYQAGMAWLNGVGAEPDRTNRGTPSHPHPIAGRPARERRISAAACRQASEKKKL